MSNATNRRIFIAAGSAAAVFGSLAAVATEAHAVDPVFAAIERHKRAHSAFNAACKLTDEVAAEQEGREVTAADEAAFAAADDKDWEAMTAFIATQPTTKPGIRAALTYIIECKHLPDGSLDDFVETLIASPVLTD